MRTCARLFPILLTLCATCAFGTGHTVQVGQDSGGMNALAFNPSTLTIAAGDTVTFVNNSGGIHNVHATSGPTTFVCSVNCTTNTAPDGSAWSDTIAFPTAGSVAYQCDAHAGFGMIGTITVTPLVPVRLQSFEVD